MEAQTVQEEQAVLSPNKKSLPFQASEWHFFCLSLFFFLSYFSSTRLRTIPLIQRGFLSKLHGHKDATLESRTKAVN